MDSDDEMDSDNDMDSDDENYYDDSDDTEFVDDDEDDTTIDLSQTSSLDDDEDDTTNDSSQTSSLDDDVEFVDKDDNAENSSDDDDGSIVDFVVDDGYHSSSNSSYQASDDSDSDDSDTQSLVEEPPQDFQGTAFLRGMLPAIICPITKEPMRDPVIGSDGFTYERSAIVEWLRANCASPMTRDYMIESDLVPNRTLKSVIDLLMERFAEDIRRILDED